METYEAPTLAQKADCERYKSWLAHLPKHLETLMALGMYLVQGCAGTVVLETTGPYIYTQTLQAIIDADAPDAEASGNLTGPPGSRVRFLPPLADNVIRYALEPHLRKANHYSLQSSPLVLKSEHEAAASPGDTTSFVLPGDAGDAREGGGADPACASRYVVDGRHITRLADDTETSFCGE